MECRIKHSPGYTASRVQKGSARKDRAVQRVNLSRARVLPEGRYMKGRTRKEATCISSRGKGTSARKVTDKTSLISGRVAYLSSLARASPDVRNEGSKSIAKKVAADAAKHADRQHRASQRCIFIAPEHKLMKRISTLLRQCNLPRPERWARHGALHDESNGESAETASFARAYVAKSACQRMTPAQRILFAQGEPGVHTSASDCHSTKKTRRMITFPTPAWPSTNERTDGASAEAKNASRSPSQENQPVANSRKTGKLRVAFAPTAGIAGVEAARLALRQR
jgi:hypothetical protein